MFEGIATVGDLKRALADFPDEKAVILRVPRESLPNPVTGDGTWAICTVSGTPKLNDWPVEIGSC